jgi:hypothetical protein
MIVLGSWEVKNEEVLGETNIFLQELSGLVIVAI